MKGGCWCWKVREECESSCSECGFGTFGRFRVDLAARRLFVYCSKRDRERVYETGVIRRQQWSEDE
jgi:hypothetical protein